MSTARRPDPATAPLFRIGEVAKLAGLTTRTLRYWDELGLLHPSGHSPGGERLYAAEAVSRAGRIRDLQELLGFSLAEARVVVETDDVDVLDRVRTEFAAGTPTPARQRALLDEAIAANDQLLARLDDTLARIETFRSERAAKGERLRARRAELGGPPGGRGAPRRPAGAAGATRGGEGERVPSRTRQTRATPAQRGAT
ncbi:MAG: MerR family transcriptional regulator [Actinomycetota bacterium]|nr:MerR family transcriptional regulator [Actinomycetota bacterium]